MPVHVHQVPLDTAKAWAKRLAKTSKTLQPNAPWKLSQAQAAVAHMLSFKDWHALEQALAPTPSALPIQSDSAIPLPNPFLHTAPHPQGQQAWQDFWAQVAPRADNLLIEARGGDTVKVSLRTFSKPFKLIDLDRANGQAMEALQALLGEESNHFLPGLLAFPPRMADYIGGALPKRSRMPSGSYQVLPIFPKGWDLCIRFAHDLPKEAGLSEIKLPSEVTQSLRRLGRQSKGVLLCTGRPASGRSTLMNALAAQIYTDVRLPSTPQSLPPPAADLIPGIDAQISLEPCDRRPLRFLTPEDPYEAGQDLDAFAQQLEQRRPDVVILQELFNKQSGDLIEMSLAKNSAVWASVVASNNPDSAIGRLEDFLPNWRQNHAGELNGIAHVHKLPLLCPFCSTPSGRHSERQAGTGCAHCSMVGRSGWQLVVDVWAMKQDQPERLADALAQARALVAQGKVAREDAEHAMGPLED